MNEKKFDKIWASIQQDLNADYSELNREVLYRAINELPTYEAPIQSWVVIEEKIRPLSKRVQLTYWAVAASIALLFSLGWYVLNLPKSAGKIQYKTISMNEYDLTQMADTTLSTFNELTDAACGIKPTYCKSEEYKSMEEEYYSIIEMQREILITSKHYDGGNRLETMLLQLESRKKDIEKQFISNINS